MYSPSPNFTNNLNEILLHNPDKIFVISAKYHVLELDEIIKPYNVSIDHLSKDKQISWGIEVAKQLKDKNIDLDFDLFYPILPNNYLKFFKSYIKNIIK